VTIRLTNNVSDISWSPDGSYIAVGDKAGGVGIWDAATGALLNQINLGEDFIIHSVDWSPDGSQLAYGTTTGNGVEIVPAPLLNSSVEPEGRDIAQVEWNVTRDRIASGATNGVIWIWDAYGQPVFSVTGDSSPITGLAWHPFFNQLASASSSGFVRVWDVGSRNVIPLHEFQVDGDATSPIWVNATTLISGSFEDRDSFRVWDTQNGEELARFHYGSISDLVLSPDFNKIAMANPGNSASILSTTDFQIMDSIMTIGQPYEVAWSESGNLIATGNLDGSIEIWDITADDAVLKHILQAGNEEYNGSALDLVSDVIFTENDTQLLSITGEGFVRRWDVQTGEKIGETLLRQTTFRATFSPDGGQVAFGSRTDFGLEIAPAPPSR
jgi:WD40 repeat protein